MTPPLPHVSLPPVQADCETIQSPALPGAIPRQSPWTLLRSADGKTRLDFGDRSVITNPAAGQTIVLDHLKKEALTLPLAQAHPELGLPSLAMPHLPAAPAIPTVPTEDLGRKIIDGHEVDGKRFTFQPPQTPTISKPQLPHTVEVWTSTKLHVPVLTNAAGSYGQQITRCKCAGREHAASLFQIPPGYKLSQKIVP